MSSTALSPFQPFFLERPLGQRFCIQHAPQGRPRGRVLFIHALAEEMNKSRRMAALQSRALAAAGFAVLQIDLLGCGDSSGDFGDASWSAWLDDLLAASTWLRAHGPAATPLWLWGHRHGCLLASELLARLDEPAGLLFWQPPAAGKNLLQQFLRLKLAGQMAEGAGGSGAMGELKQALAAGETVDIAGYRLAPALAAGLEAAQLTPPATPTPALWFEVSPQAEAALPVTAAAAERWRAAGCAPALSLVQGPAFWQTTEIEEAPALIEATTTALLSQVQEPVPA